ncbi:hypothetical protein L596_028193 [Steinernema carpocapsae]|uniref:Uncharacterized protein n=1 Tax=Steinernema carpocapsae TaxID=34508 RepID=A0A4V5ZXT5_STECR|nr:hypothetical protein L596_028193 [Steinernema carpocapsae]
MRPRLSAFILACVHLSLGSVKYTILPSSFVGQFGGSEEVKNVDQCSARAHRSNKIAFRVELKEKQMFCSMLEGFRSFEAKRGDNVRDYVLDTSKDASICYGKGEQNVIKLVSGACSAGRKGCGMLKDMNTYCQFVGRDIPNCVSGKGDTIDQAKCPEKHTFIGIEKEALLCCPPQTSFVKESNKKALCCPSNTQLEQEINGRAVCCSDGTKFQREENGKDLCCPKNTVLKGTSEGKPVCCPANYNLNQGWTHCCPEGFAFKQSFKKCVGIVSMAAKPPQTTDELKQHCTDKENSVPVKIENVDQNRDVPGFSRRDRKRRRADRPLRAEGALQDALDRGQQQNRLQQYEHHRQRAHVRRQGRTFREDAIEGPARSGHLVHRESAESPRERRLRRPDS